MFLLCRPVAGQTYPAAVTAPAAVMPVDIGAQTTLAAAIPQPAAVQVALQSAAPRQPVVPSEAIGMTMYAIRHRKFAAAPNCISAPALIAIQLVDIGTIMNATTIRLRNATATTSTSAPVKTIAAVPVATGITISAILNPSVTQSTLTSAPATVIAVAQVAIGTMVSATANRPATAITSVFVAATTVVGQVDIGMMISVITLPKGVIQPMWHSVPIHWTVITLGDIGITTAVTMTQHQCATAHIIICVRLVFHAAQQVATGIMTTVTQFLIPVLHLGQPVV